MHKPVQGREKRFENLISYSQAGPGRKAKQSQEEIYRKYQLLALYVFQISMEDLFLRIVVIVDVVKIGVLGKTKLGRKEIDNFLSAVCSLDGRRRTVVSSGLVLVTTHSLPKQTFEQRKQRVLPFLHFKPSKYIPLPWPQSKREIGCRMQQSCKKKAKQTCTSSSMGKFDLQSSAVHSCVVCCCIYSPKSVFVWQRLRETQAEYLRKNYVPPP